MILTIFTFIPGHLGTDELECGDAAPQVRSIAFRLHGKSGIVWAAMDAGLDGITEMSVDILIFSLRLHLCVRRHSGIGCFVGIIGIIKAFCLSEGFQSPDHGVKELGIVFFDKDLDTGRVEERHGNLVRINLPADRFCQINEPIKNSLKIIAEMLPEGSRNNFIKVNMVFKEIQEPGAYRDPKYPGNVKKYLP